MQAFVFIFCSVFMDSVMFALFLNGNSTLHELNLGSFVSILLELINDYICNLNLFDTIKCLNWWLPVFFLFFLLLPLSRHSLGILLLVRLKACLTVRVSLMSALQLFLGILNVLLPHLNVKKESCEGKVSKTTLHYWLCV